MIKKLGCAPRLGIVSVAALFMVLSIALLAKPQLLMSQTSKTPQQFEEMIDRMLQAPAKEGKFSGVVHGDSRSGKFISTNVIPGLGRLDTEGEMALTGSFTGTDLAQIFSQLREQYAENPDDFIEAKITDQGGKPVASVTVNGKTFHVSNNNKAFSTYFANSRYDLQYILSSEERITAPVLIHRVEPVYPEAAKESGISGDILLNVSTDVKGEIMRISAIDGHPDLKEAAINAVRQWRYDPATDFDGNPTMASFGFIVYFLPDGTVNIEESKYTRIFEGAELKDIDLAKQDIK